MPPVVQRQLDQVREWLVWLLTLVVGLGIQVYTGLAADVRRIDAEQQRRTQYTQQVAEAREDLKSLRALMLQLGSVQAQEGAERRERLAIVTEQMSGVLLRLDRIDGRLDSLVRHTSDAQRGRRGGE